MTGAANLGDVFAAHAASDRIAVVDLFRPDAPKTVSYRALDAACGAVAAGLGARGLGPGDRVAVCALNRYEYLAALFGAMRAGCVPVMVNVKLPAETVRFIVADSGAKLVFADGGFAERRRETGIDGPPAVSFDDPGPDGFAAMAAGARRRPSARRPARSPNSLTRRARPGGPKGCCSTTPGSAGWSTGWSPRAA